MQLTTEIWIQERSSWLFFEALQRWQRNEMHHCTIVDILFSLNFYSERANSPNPSLFINDKEKQHLQANGWQFCFEIDLLTSRSHYSHSSFQTADITECGTHVLYWKDTSHLWAGEFHTNLITLHKKNDDLVWNMTSPVSSKRVKERPASFLLQYRGSENFLRYHIQDVSVTCLFQSRVEIYSTFWIDAMKTSVLFAYLKPYEYCCRHSICFQWNSRQTPNPWMP